MNFAQGDIVLVIYDINTVYFNKDIFVRRGTLGVVNYFTDYFYSIKIVGEDEFELYQDLLVWPDEIVKFNKINQLLFS